MLKKQSSFVTEIHKKIYFRADGNSKMGLGHVIRSLALADMLKQDFECHFIIREPENSISEQILEICDGIHSLPQELEFNDEKDYLVSNLINCDDIIVLDGYHFKTAYQQVIKDHGCPLVSIDDIHDFPFLADLLINHAGGMDRSKYTLPFYTKCCFGMDYLLLRRPFLEATKEVRHFQQIDTAFVCMGGADPTNFTLKILSDYLPRIQGLKAAIVVLGNSYLFRESLEQVIESSPVRITILQDINAEEMVEAMQRSQIGICSASSICYEYLCVGGGLFVALTVDNQQDLYHFLIDHQLAAPISELGAKTNFKKMINLQRKAADGRSPKRLLKLFKQLAQKPILKKATGEEMALYHHWANDPKTRAQSFNSDPIALEDHRKWFNQKLSAPKAFLYTAYYRKEPIGQIRFDIHGNEAVISYAVAPDHRGKGLGFEIIKFGILTLKKECPGVKVVSGLVKRRNIASVKTFKKLNFTESSPDDPQRFPGAYKFMLNISNEIF